MPELPSWIKPADTLGAMSQGASVGLRRAQMAQQAQEHGASVAAEQYANVLRANSEAARLNQQAQMESERLAQQQMEFQARQQVQQQQQLKQQQQLAVENQYKQAEIGLRQANLKRASEAATMKTQEEAKKFAELTGLSQDVQGGMSPQQAIFKHPSLITPGVLANVTHPQKPAPEMSPIETENYKDAMMRRRIALATLSKGGLDPEAKAATQKQMSDANREIINMRAAAEKKKSSPAAVPEGAQKFPTPSQKSLDHLKQNPDLKDMFEKTYGPGSADKVLGGDQSSADEQTPDESETAAPPEEEPTPA